MYSSRLSVSLSLELLQRWSCESEVQQSKAQDVISAWCRAPSVPVDHLECRMLPLQRRHCFYSVALCRRSTPPILLRNLPSGTSQSPFRNAPAVSKSDHVQIATLGVNNAYCSVLPQSPLNDCLIPIFDPLTVFAEICQCRARDY